MTHVKGFAFFLRGPKGRVAMQTLALQTFLREDGVQQVVFQGQYRGCKRTFSIRRNK